MLRPTVSRPVSLGVRHPSGTHDQFSPSFSCIDNCGFLGVGRPLWREDWSVIYCTIASGPCQSSDSRARVQQNSYILPSHLRLPQPGQSELHYNWRPVSRYVLVSCPIWDFWPEIYFFFFLNLQSCLIWGALSDERSGLSFVSLLSI
jgi:hypothetical protein